MWLCICCIYGLVVVHMAHSCLSSCESGVYMYVHARYALCMSVGMCCFDARRLLRNDFLELFGVVYVNAPLYSRILAVV